MTRGLSMNDTVDHNELPGASLKYTKIRAALPIGQSGSTSHVPAFPSPLSRTVDPSSWVLSPYQCPSAANSNGLVRLTGPPPPHLCHLPTSSCVTSVAVVREAGSHTSSPHSRGGGGTMPSAEPSVPGGGSSTIPSTEPSVTGGMHIGAVPATLAHSRPPVQSL